ncbi:tRNA guanosine(34) transglycosylase Tgt [soil metagenome]
MPVTLRISDRSRVSRARRGVVETPHGAFETPAFMPVGTRGTVKGVLPELLAATGAQICLANTYHLLLRPGSARVARLGGLHAMMRWDRPILTDSGGYQAFSMADVNTIDDEGVTFKSIVDGATVHLSPERAIQVQNELGADIIMAFDDCPPSAPGEVEEPRGNGSDVGAGAVRVSGSYEPGSNREDPRLARALARDTRAQKKRGGAFDHAARLRTANERTVRWLERCKAAHARPGEQALFGIIQGGVDLEQRTWSAERITNIDLPGYAIGGVAVGEKFDDILRVVAHTAPLMPEGKPRYLMGVGYERDLLAAVLSGVDMFDCVLPTRNGRNASAFTSAGSIRLRNAKFADDTGVIESGCDCHACGGGFSRGYIRHLFMVEEMLGPILVSLHNLRHFQRFMADVRGTIATDDWERLALRWPVAREGLRALGSA